MKCYLDKGVCTNPVVCGGRYWHRHAETRNCVLRVEHGYSLSEIGVSMGISKQAVRKIEKRAMAKLSTVFAELGYPGDIERSTL
jgi:hypothetical protein